MLRGVAILMVLLLHFGLTYQVWDQGPFAGLVGPAWAFSILGWGNFGVTVFFTVSGFLITTNTALRAGSLGQVNLRAFYARRFARIVPCLLLALAVIVPLGLLGVPSFSAEGARPRAELLLGAASVLGFVHNLLMQKLGYFDYCLNVYWSLSVEEVFYLAFPLTCRLLRRETLIALPCLVLIAAAPVYRAAHADNDIYYLYANLACFDALAIGCLAALLARRWQPQGAAAFTMRTLGWLALAAVWLHGFGDGNKALSFSAIALATACIILARRQAEARPRRSPIQWLGAHSYELYLFHIIVLAVMRDVVPGPALRPAWQPAWLLLFLATSAAAASVVTITVGQPAGRALTRRLSGESGFCSTPTLR